MLKICVQRRLTEFMLDVDVTCRYPVTAVYGPSGAGKTSLLNMVAGLLRPKKGEIALDGRTLFATTASIDLPPEQRSIGYVLQDDLLFPHLTVAANLRFGYDQLKPEERQCDFGQIVDLLDIWELLPRYPERLSGGERQRVALGRALLRSPALLLMDEPLASLDQGLKSRIIPYLRHVKRELQIPILYVTHSVAEILELTGQVIVLQRGQVIAHGDFFRIISQPRVMPLVEEHGFENVLKGETVGSQFADGTSWVRFFNQNLLVPHHGLPDGKQLFLGVRANDIALSRSLPDGISISNSLAGKVVEITEVSGSVLVYVDVGSRLAVKITGQSAKQMNLALGDKLYCLIKTHSFRIGPEVE